MEAIITALTAIWDALSEWFIGAINDVSALFWTPASGSTGGSFTFIGVLALVGLGISVVFLLVNVVKRFIRLK